MPFFRKLVLAFVVAFLVAGAPTAAAKDREIRVQGSCTGSGRAELRLRAEDGRIRIEFQLRDVGGRSWSVIVLHERRTASRRAVRSDGGGLQFRSSVADWFGTDAITVRATASNGASCRASATL